MLKIPVSSGTLPTNSPEREVSYSSYGTPEKEQSVSSASSPKKGLTPSLAGVAKVEEVLRRKFWWRHFSGALARSMKATNKQKPQAFIRTTEEPSESLREKVFPITRKKSLQNQEHYSLSVSSTRSRPNHFCWKNNLLALGLTETQKQDARHLNLNLILGPGQDWELRDSWLCIRGTKIKVHIDLQK